MVRGHNSDFDIRSGDIGDHITRLTASTESGSGHSIVVPDAELLLSAKYSKQGADLVLTSADGHKFVITGYFNGEKHADLRAPGGATLSADTIDKLTVSDTPGQYAQVGAPAGAAVIGKVERIGGSATVQHANGTTEELHIGDTLRQGDVVQTGDGSQLGLSLSDGTAFNMGAGARMVLSELIYDATNTSSNAAVFSLVKGSISFVAGKVAKTGDMKVETPVATMGIRGTSVNTNISADVNGNIVSVTYSLMADPDGHVGSFNILDRTTGAIIGTISTTDTTYVVTPSANLGILATQTGKTPEQIAQELAVAQALFPIYLANPANFDQQNQNVNPQNQPTKSGSVGSSEVFAGGSQTPIDNGIHNNGTPGQQNSGPDFHTTQDPGTGGSTDQGTPGETTQVTLHNNAAPLVIADTNTTHLKEAGNFFQPGVSTSVANITKTDIDGTVTYDVAALLAAHWVLVSTGVYALDGHYGTATLNTVTNVLTYKLDNSNPATDALGTSSHPAETFTIPVVDNQGATAFTNVVFTVDGTNDAPKFDGGPLKIVSIDENTANVFTAHATDVDSSTLTYSIVTGLLSPDASKFSIDPHTGALTFNAAPDYEHPTDFLHNNIYEVQIKVSDGSLSDIQTVAVVVNDVNDTPHAGNDIVITNNAASSTFLVPEWALLTNDTGPSPLDITGISSRHGLVSADLTSHQGNVTVHDDSHAGGSFDYTLSFGQLTDTDTGSVTITQDTGTMNGSSASEIFIGNSAGTTINANGGNDILIGNGGDDTLNGGSGNDIYGFGLSDGCDTIHDTSGNDTIRIDTGGAALTGLDFSASDCNDDLVIKFNNQEITVTDHFSGSNNVEWVTFVGGPNGGSFAGYALGGTYNLSNDTGGTPNLSGNDILSGNSESNHLNGGAGNDLLFGNRGCDTLNGGTGNDLLVGGGGGDTFVFNANFGHDTVADFQVCTDTIKIDAGLFTSVADMLAHHTQDVGGNAVITLDAGNSITFQGVNTATLTAHQSDFHLIA